MPPPISQNQVLGDHGRAINQLINLGEEKKQGRWKFS